MGRPTALTKISSKVGRLWVQEYTLKTQVEKLEKEDEAHLGGKEEKLILRNDCIKWTEKLSVMWKWWNLREGLESSEPSLTLLKGNVLRKVLWGL